MNPNSSRASVESEPSMPDVFLGDNDLSQYPWWGSAGNPLRSVELVVCLGDEMVAELGEIPSVSVCPNTANGEGWNLTVDSGPLRHEFCFELLKEVLDRSTQLRETLDRIAATPQRSVLRFIQHVSESDWSQPGLVIEQEWIDLLGRWGGSIDVVTYVVD